MLITIVYGVCTLYPISYVNKFDELIYKDPCVAKYTIDYPEAGEKNQFLPLCSSF